jgi:hypothetical protein
VKLIAKLHKWGLPVIWVHRRDPEPDRPAVATRPPAQVINLNVFGPLTPEQRAEIERHRQAGYRAFDRRHIEGR